MGMMKEFKEFVMKGNVIDMAVGIVIGIAFGKIIGSLVTDIIMPPIGILLGGVDFSNLSWVIKEATEAAEAVTLNYGKFIITIIEFIIIAFSIFMVIKAINNAKKKEEEKPAEPLKPSEEVMLLKDIRDVLKK